MARDSGVRLGCTVAELVITIGVADLKRVCSLTRLQNISLIHIYVKVHFELLILPYRAVNTSMASQGYTQGGIQPNGLVKNNFNPAQTRYLPLDELETSKFPGVKEFQIEVSSPPIPKKGPLS